MKLNGKGLFPIRKNKKKTPLDWLMDYSYKVAKAFLKAAPLFELCLFFSFKLQLKPKQTGAESSGVFLVQCCEICRLL